MPQVVTMPTNKTTLWKFLKSLRTFVKNHVDLRNSTDKMNRSRVGYIPPPRLKNPCRCDECMELEFKREQAKIYNKSHLPHHHPHYHETSNDDKKYFLEHLNEEDAYDTKQNFKGRRNASFDCPQGERSMRRHEHTGSGDTRHCEGIHYGRHEYESDYHLVNKQNNKNAWKPKVFLELEECQPSAASPTLPNQDSRTYLDMIKLVRKMKPLWDEIVAENQTDARLHRYRPGVHKRFDRFDNEHSYAESPPLPHRERKHGSPKHRKYKNHNRNEKQFAGHHIYEPVDLVDIRHHRKLVTRSDSESSTYRKHIPRIHKSRKSGSDVQGVVHKNTVINRETKKHIGRENKHPKEGKPEKYHQEVELEIGSSNEWNDTDSDKIKINKEQARNSEHYEEDGELTPSKYTYAEKRKLFSPKQSLVTPTKTQEQSRDSNTLKSKTQRMDLTEGKENSFRTTYIQNVEDKTWKTRANIENKTNNSARGSLQGTTEAKRQKSVARDNDSLDKYDQMKHARYRDCGETKHKLITQSEGGKRNIIRKSDQNVHKSNSGPMLSKYSQTQAELELDFKLLKRNQEQATETKSSQTEMILDESTKVKEEDSWDEWISEGSKRKPKKKHSKSINADIQKSSEQNDEILYKTTEAPAIEKTREFKTETVETTDRTSKSIPVYSNTKKDLRPRRSQSDSANPASPQKHYRTSFYTEIHPESQNQQNVVSSFSKSPVKKTDKNINYNQNSVPGTHEDGFKVLRHSQSLSWTQLAHKEKQTTGGHRGRSQASAPVRGSKVRDSYFTASGQSESVDFVTGTASTSYAMEHAGIGPGVYTDETLRRLSEQYDQLVMAQPTVQSLDVQDSRTVLNDSVKKMRHDSNTNIREGRNSLLRPDPTEKFVWRSHSFLPGEAHSSQNDSQIKTCQKCNGMFLEGEEFLESKSLNIRWHVRCFQCETCEETLDQTNHYFCEDRLFCLKHYAKKVNIPKCAGCQEFIFDDRYTLAHGVPWHTDHFKCRHCERTIVESKYVSTHGENFCLQCHRNLMARKCNTCGLIIAVTQPFVQTGDKVWHAREECFHCFTCHKSLVNRSRMFEKNGVTFCNRYCAIRNVPPV